MTYEKSSRTLSAKKIGRTASIFMADKADDAQIENK